MLAWPRVAVPPRACYTITSKRVLFQFGVALPMTMNIPFGKIANAALKTYRDGSGDIPLHLSDGNACRICCCGRISGRGGCAAGADAEFGPDAARSRRNWRKR